MPTPHTQGEEHEWETNNLGGTQCKNCGQWLSNPIFPPFCISPTPTQEPKEDRHDFIPGDFIQKDGETIRLCESCKKPKDDSYAHIQYFTLSHQPSEGWDEARVIYQFGVHQETELTKEEVELIEKIWPNDKFVRIRANLLAGLLNREIATARREEREETVQKCQNILDTVIGQWWGKKTQSQSSGAVITAKIEMQKLITHNPILDRSALESAKKILHTTKVCPHGYDSCGICGIIPTPPTSPPTPRN